jgi:hypothetical protein
MVRRAVALLRGGEWSGMSRPCALIWACCSLLPLRQTMAWRHVPDQVEQAVFQRACFELVDQMHYQPGLSCCRCHDLLRS